MVFFVCKYKVKDSPYHVETLDKYDSFSIIHALAYSFIGFQTMFIATNWNPIYWNTACLIVNSGALETDEDDDEKSTDYGKIAKALGDIISRGVKVSLVDINKSDYGFLPDAENNTILFGLKALSNVGLPVIESIKAGRPYKNIKDFMNRCPLNKSAMISLIKAGAFDNIDKKYFGDRRGTMAYYISKVCNPKEKLTLQNFNGLMQKGLIPKSLDFECRIFNFNKYLKTVKYKEYYLLSEPYVYNFYINTFDYDTLCIVDQKVCLNQKEWDKTYKKIMDKARDWIKANEQQILKDYNTLLFKEMWNKYAKGSISDWEMDSLCFYYHEHPLVEVNTLKYGIVNFKDLSPIPPVEYYFKRNGIDIPIYKTYKIIGTVIGKNDNKSSISLLTTTGVVNVKFTKEYYAMFARQLSERQEDGTKKVVEKGWFTRGSKLMLTGIRRDDTFVTKTYKNTPTHQIYLIKNVDKEGNMELVHDRYKEQD
jgi:DNA polymerase-3 subunit alpha